MIYSRVDFSSYCVMSIWFGCNSHCSICMLSKLKKTLPPLEFGPFKETATGLAREGRFHNLILSGGEVTTFQNLERYIRFAASLGFFRKIQIQTNGRRLSDRRYLEHLIEWGTNEFFVSVQGLEETNDFITGVPGSFRQTLEGIHNLAGYGVNVISNTVLTKKTFPELIRLVKFLSDQPLNEIQLWNYFPMDGRDSGDHLIPLKEFARMIPELSSCAAAAGKPFVLKSFPECLSIGPPIFFDSVFPATVLPDIFWKEFGRSGFGKCFYRERKECRARNCWGLPSAYIEKYGDERDILRPM